MAECLEIVESVALFPLKGGQAATARGETIQTLDIGPLGLEYSGVCDRGLVLVDQNGLVITQRGSDENGGVKFKTDTRLSLVSIDIQPDHLAISAPGAGHIELGTDCSNESDPTAFDIFEKTFYGKPMGYEASEFFTRYVGFGRLLTLYRADPETPRLISEKYRKTLGNGHLYEAANQMAGADGHPILWARQETLNRLHMAAGIPLFTKHIRDYRANINSGGKLAIPEGLLDPNSMYAEEDFVAFVVMGGLEAYNSKACDRCEVPNTNQRTGERDGLSTKLLAGTRRGRLSLEPEGTRNRPMYAENLNHLVRSIGKTVSVGDVVNVDQWNTEPNIILKHAA